MIKLPEDSEAKEFCRKLELLQENPFIYTKDQQSILYCLTDFCYVEEEQIILDSLKKRTNWYAQIVIDGKETLEAMLEEDKQDLQKYGAKLPSQSSNNKLLYSKRPYKNVELEEEISHIGILIHQNRLYIALYIQQFIGLQYGAVCSYAEQFVGDEYTHAALYPISAEDLTIMLYPQRYAFNMDIHPFEETLGYSSILRILPKELFKHPLPESSLTGVHTITELVERCWKDKENWRKIGFKSHRYDYEKVI